MQVTRFRAQRRLKKRALVIGLAGSVAAALGLASLAGRDHQQEAAAVPDDVLETLAAVFPELTESSELDGPTLVEGRIEGSAGEIPAAGTPVIAVASPPGEDITAEPSDWNVELIPVAKGTTDDDGDFVLRTGDPGLVASLTDDNGILNLQLLTPTLPWDQLGGVDVLVDTDEDGSQYYTDLEEEGEAGQEWSADGTPGSQLSSGEPLPDTDGADITWGSHGGTRWSGLWGQVAS